MLHIRIFSPISLRICLALGLLAAATHTPSAPDSDPLGEKTGGNTTVYATGRNAFSFPAANLEDAERTRFAIGNSFFRRNWVQAPASTKARDGLGPHFIARSCGGCHVQDGRGAPPEITNRLGETTDPTVALLIRLSIPGQDAHGGPKHEPVYGDQFNNAAIRGVKPEGRVTLRYSTMKGQFADGTPYELLQPHYGFADLGYGPMHPQVMVSPRVAPQMIGVGLLEAIDAADILANAKAQAAAHAAGTSLIKGETNHVWNAPTGTMMLGRFGWKANVATLAHQTGGAFVGDIGITSRHFPNEACTPAQKDCLAAPSGKIAAHKGAPEVEIDDATFDNVVFYQATLAPPARRNASDPQVLRGQALFTAAQCATCHHPSYTTKARPNEGVFARLTSPALHGQKIWPYTDMLLHDMGEGLADGRPDFKAHGRQWRTPPLWGIGLIKDVNGHNRLLHDGRARGVLEAVLWHDGEAKDAKEMVLKMSKEERDALVKFVESL